MEEKEEEIDRLSGLPDYLLIHILSFMGEDSDSVYYDGDVQAVKRAAKSTCLLSKSWRYLWTQLPILKFFHQTYNVRTFVSFVHTTLSNRGEIYLKNFSVRFRYNQIQASDVDAWVEYALKCMVGKLVLLLLSKDDVDVDVDVEEEGEDDGDIYVLPQIVYSNSSLRELVLQDVRVAPLGRIEWKSLTRLVLEFIELDECVVENIISGCPLLYSWSINFCRGINRLTINSPSVHKLSIWHFYNDLEISVPHLQVLHVGVNYEREWRLRNAPCLVRASFDLSFWDISLWCKGKMMNHVHSVFEATMHNITNLVLGSNLLEFISRATYRGYQIPPFPRQCLTIRCNGYKNVNMFGIIKLLQSSPELETLYVDDSKATKETAFIWTSHEICDMNIELPLLKNVTIKCSVQTCRSNGLILMLAQIILKTAKALENMSLFIPREYTSWFDKFVGDVLSYPKSSHHAVIHIA